MVHLIVTDVPVPQVVEEILEVIKVIPQERVSERVVEQIVDVPVLRFVEEIVEIVAGEVVCNARTGDRRQHGWTCTYLPW